MPSFVTVRDAGLISTVPKRSCPSPPRRAMLGDPRPTQQRADARQQLEHAARLGDVVVRAEAEAEDLVGLFAARREDQHRNVRSAFAQRLEHAIAVHARKHEIEHHEIGAPRARALESGLAVLGDLHFVAFDLETRAQSVGEIGIVFDDENARHGEWECCPSSRGDARSSLSTSWYRLELHVGFGG